MSTWKLILALVLLFPSLLYGKLKDKQFDIIKNSDSFFTLIGKDYGTNVGIIVNEKGLLLIDPMPGEKSVDDLHNLIKSISNYPISYVVNTHMHEDHTGGNTYFKKIGAEILDPKELLVKSGSVNETSLLHKDYGLEVIKVESHTHRDMMYFHPKSKVLFVGDVFDNSWHPTFYAGGIEGMTRSIEIILAMGDKDTLIVPGHGLPATKEIVKAFYENTLVWLERVSKLHSENKSIDQIMEDEQINEILQRFNTEQRKDFIPQRAFRRFIERTISITSSNQ